MSIDYFFEDKKIYHLSSESDENFSLFVCCSSTKSLEVIANEEKNSSIQLELFANGWLIKDMQEKLE